MPQSFLRDVSVTAIASIVAAALTLVGVYVTGWFNYASKDEELRVHLVEIAIGVLSTDPNKDPDIKPVREWAMDIVDRNSGVQFSAAARNALLQHEIPAPPSIVSFPDPGGNTVTCSRDPNTGLFANCHVVPKGLQQ